MEWRVGTISELRMNSRIRTCVRCELDIEQTAYVGHLLSISLSGALISLGCKPALGSQSKITVELLNPARKISLPGYVVRVRRDRLSHDEVAYRVGIRFYAISPDGILLLKAALEKSESCFA
jgi:hypothetical protein